MSDEAILRRIQRLCKDDQAFTELVALLRGRGLSFDGSEVSSSQELARSRKLLVVGQLASGIAHDFNNLLSVILTYSDSLLYELPSFDPRRRDVDEIRMAASRAATLTRQLLAFSYRESGHAQAVELNKSVDNMLRLLGRLLGEQVELRSSFDEDVGQIWLDPGELDQIVLNLAVAARDAIPSPSVLQIESNVAVLSPEQAQRTGLPTQRFFRLSFEASAVNSNTPPGELLDAEIEDSDPELGPRAVAEIIAQRGGKLLFSRAQGAIRFDVFLFPHEEEARDFSPITPSSGQEVILLVEDEIVLRRLATRVLRDHGYEVIEARDGENALAKVEGVDVALLVTDVVMPRMGGNEVAAELMRRNPDLKVIFTSGYPSMRPDFSTLGEPSNCEFLPKPYTRVALLQAIRSLLDR